MGGGDGREEYPILTRPYQKYKIEFQLSYFERNNENWDIYREESDQCKSVVT